MALSESVEHWIVIYYPNELEFLASKHAQGEKLGRSPLLYKLGLEGGCQCLCLRSLSLFPPYFSLVSQPRSIMEAQSLNLMNALENIHTIKASQILQTPS